MKCLILGMLFIQMNSFANGFESHTKEKDFAAIVSAAEEHGVSLKNVKAPVLRQSVVWSLNVLERFAELIGNWASDTPIRSKAYVITAEVNGNPQTCFATVVNFKNGSSEVSVFSCGENAINNYDVSDLFPKTRVW